MTHSPRTSKTKETQVDAAPQGTMSWSETVDDGMTKRTRTVVSSPWDEERYQCYCCTCDAHDAVGIPSLADPYCRNHNFGFGSRPCDIHNLPGEVYTDDVGGPHVGQMPMAVNAYREAVTKGEPTH